MDIKTIRGQYPQYSDLSDDELARGLHKKHYSDMPFEEFAGKIGLEPTKQSAGGSRSWADVGKEAVTNIPSSAGRLMEDMVTPIIHPVDTAKAIYGLGTGAAQMLIPGEQENEKYARAFWDSLEKRYGGMEELKETIAKDPVGALSDFASLFSGGATAVGKVASTGGRLARAAEAVRGVASAVDPAAMAVRDMGKVVSGTGGLMGKLGESMYASTLKPSTKIPSARRNEIIAAGLENAITPDAPGQAKLSGIIVDQAQRVEDAISGLEDAGETVRTEAVLSRLEGIKDKARTSVTPESSVAQIEDIERQFRSAFGTEISPTTAQKIKQTTGTELRKQYGEMKGWEVEARKNIVRGLKEELEGLYPEIKAMNKKESVLIGLDDVLESAVNRIDNRNLLGLTELGGSIAGGTAAGPVGALGGLVMTKIIRSPEVQSRLAFALHRARKGGKRAGEAITKAPDSFSIGLRQAGRIEGFEEEEEQ